MAELILREAFYWMKKREYSWVLFTCVRVTNSRIVNVTLSGCKFSPYFFLTVLVGLCHLFNLKLSWVCLQTMFDFPSPVGPTNFFSYGLCISYANEYAYEMHIQFKIFNSLCLLNNKLRFWCFLGKYGGNCNCLGCENYKDGPIIWKKERGNG